MNRFIHSLLVPFIVSSALFAVSLAGARTAAASTDFVFGAGSAPDIAVDGAGTAHVVWLDESQGPVQARTVYCRIPRGARACTNTQVLYMGDGGSSPRVLLQAPQTVIVILGRYACGSTTCVLTRVSGDAGLTFFQAKTVSEGNPLGPGGGFYADASGEAVDGPGNSVSFVNSGTYALFFTNTSLDPAAQPALMPAELTPSAVDSGTIGLWGNVPVVVYRDNGVLRWRRYDYSLVCQKLNAAGCWSTAQDIDTDADSGGVSLAGGPSGLFLYYEQGPPGAAQGVVRKFNGSGWGSAIPVTSSGYLRPGDVSQDASGRLQVVWFNKGGDTDGLTQWRTSTDGVNWTPTITINTDTDVLDSVHVSAAPDGQGFAVWDSEQPGGSWDYLRAVPLEPFTFPPQPPHPVQPPPHKPTPPPDKRAPMLSGFTIGTRTLHSGQATTFAFGASEGGRGVLTFYRLGNGLKLGPRGAPKCLPKTPGRQAALKTALAGKPAVARLHGKARQRKLAKLVAAHRCTTRKRIGDIQTAVQPGYNTVVFTDTLAGGTLAPGHYLAALVIRDAAGNTSRRETVRYRIVASKK
jgi:hypothetical protein